MRTHQYHLTIITSAIVVGMAHIAPNHALVRFSSRANAQTPAETIAAQIREQGYRCHEPVGAKRDAKLSKPDEAVWVLKCSNAIYRVRLDPDMAAHVTKLK